jgi:hypothetical protein
MFLSLGNVSITADLPFSEPMPDTVSGSPPSGADLEHARQPQRFKRGNYTLSAATVIRAGTPRLHIRESKPKNKMEKKITKISNEIKTKSKNENKKDFEKIKKKK